MTVYIKASAFHRAALEIGRSGALSLAPMRQMTVTMPRQLPPRKGFTTAELLTAARMMPASNTAIFGLRHRMPAVEAVNAMRRARRDRLSAVSNAPLIGLSLREAAYVLGHRVSQFAKAGLRHARYRFAMIAAQGDRVRTDGSAVGWQLYAGAGGFSLPRYQPRNGLLGGMPHGQMKLPSIAPVSRPGRPGRAESFAADRNGYAAADASPNATEPKTPALTVVNQARLSAALADLLNRQSRLPPSGATGFDPRLSPAWPGLKLPN